MVRRLVRRTFRARVACRAGALFGLWLGLSAPAAGQVVPGPQPAAEPPASELQETAPLPQNALSAARAAQGRFERLRRQWSPLRRGAWGGGGCDEQVGRLCLRYDEGGDWWPGPEDPRIVQARLELLERLEAAVARAPGDFWIRGQALLYSVEAGRWPDAERFARECTGPAADCGLLLGYLHHTAGRHLEAEAAFRSALADMDGEARTRWMDPAVLLDPAGAGHLQGLRRRGAAAVEAAVEFTWRLADPLYLVPGNDRLTEHWARRVLARLREGAVNPYALSWGGDLAEVLLRYGAEVGWERTLDAYGIPTNGVVGHHHPQSRRYLPPGELLRDPSWAEPGRWTVAPAAPREVYAPPYAPVILPAPGELLRFPRGQRVVVVATWAMPEDTSRHAGHDHPRFVPAPGLRDRPLEAGLFLLPLPGAGEILEKRQVGAAARPLALEVPAGAYLASTEVWDPAAGLAGRRRETLLALRPPPGPFTLSDLALLERPLPEGAGLEQALGALRPPGPLVGGEPVAVGWELHGTFPGDALLSYRLTLERGGRGLLRRIGDRLGITQPPPPLRLTWQEAARAGTATLFRTLTLDLGEVGAGDYLLRLEVEAPGTPPVASERALTVTARPRSGTP